MVLQLKPPEHPTFAALALLWPTALSCAVSYFFIAIVWVNHHYLLRMAEGATPQLILFAYLRPELSGAPRDESSLIDK
jgi:uncharacterized membrane protein